MQSLITIRKYTLPLEAELARIHLESKGVRAVLLDLNISGLYRHLSSVFPVRVLVATDDGQRTTHSCHFPQGYV